MATISDAQLVAVLRPFVRACAPTLDALRESDPLRLKARDGHEPAGRGFGRSVVRALASVRAPGTAAWEAMDTPRRVRWWTGRFGRLTALLTAVPGLGGVLADRLPVQDLLGAGSQGLVLCAIAGECGVTDTGARVRLLAAVLFDRVVEPDLASGRGVGQDQAGEDAEVERLAGHRHRVTGAVSVLTTLGGGLWRLARSLRGISAELGKRPSGRWYHRALGAVPGIGAVGDYFGERAGMRVVRARALRWLTTHAVAAPR
ncbi:hypothetical protein [Amycolatopsis sp. NBC_00438]|uniref:hypothetical protein n=1 Tax=Amycolatopsis sp. NBC_00438 TaxID=2903558 RepID=UPI002E1E21EE